MRELGLKCQIRVKKHSRQKASEQYIQDNVLNQNFDTDAPNKVWLSDSTELRFGPNGEYKIRLSGVLDLYVSTRTLYQPDFKQKRQIIPDTGSRPAGIICRSLYAH